MKVFFEEDIIMSFCTKCGAQNPDTSAFCEQCGSPLSAQPTQPVQAEPVQSAQPVQPMQPSFGQQPQQFQQPPFGQQPAYAAPVYSQPVAKKSKTVPIVIGACAVVVAAFLVILFTVIIPGSSVTGKLKHKWTYTENGASVTYDLKENTLSMLGLLSVPLEWEVKGDNRLSITMTVSMFGETQSETEEYTFSLSSNGKELTLTNTDGDSLKLYRDD